MAIDCDRARRLLNKLRSPNILVLDSSNSAGPSRVLPVGMCLAVWLTTTSLIAMITTAVALLALIWAIKFSDLPVDWALRLDQRTTQGTVDSVDQRSERVKGAAGKNLPSRKQFVFSYHFDLPDGRTFTGKSATSSTGNLRAGAVVTVEYYSGRPQLSRIEGMAADDKQNIYWLAFVLIVISGITWYKGILDAKVNQKLLIHGTLGQALVTYCRRDKSGTGYLTIGDYTWPSKSQAAEIPLADFHQMEFENHRHLFDAHGKFNGTAGLRSLHVAIAAFFGGLIAFIVVFVSTTAMQGRPKLDAVLASACAGACLLALAESKWRFLLRSNFKKSVGDMPDGFRNCQCILQCKVNDGLNVVSVNKTIDLRGDASDLEPYPILYHTGPPRLVRLLGDFDLSSAEISSGIYKIDASPALPKLLGVISVGLLCLIGLGVILFAF